MPPGHGVEAVLRRYSTGSLSFNGYLAPPFFVVVYRFVVACRYRVRLVPDTYAPVGADRPVEAPPGGEVWVVGVPGESFEVLIGVQYWI